METKKWGNDFGGLSVERPRSNRGGRTATLLARLSLLPVAEGELDLWEGVAPAWAERAPVP